MCRNITTLRGLEPAASSDEIAAAARQYVRKVSGVQKTSESTEAAFERAVAIVTSATRELISELPPRKVPPKTEPPIRRIARARAAIETGTTIFAPWGAQCGVTESTTDRAVAPIASPAPMAAFRPAQNTDGRPPVSSAT